MREQIEELRFLVDSLEGGFDESIVKRIAHGLKMVFGKLRKVKGNSTGGEAHALKKSFNAAHRELRAQTNALKNRRRVPYPA